LSLDTEEIVELLNNYEKDSKAIKKSLLKMCWYMRGGMTLDEAWITSFHDRELINDIIKENLEITKETTLPFF
jgi:DNA polymerase III delta subunit